MAPPATLLSAVPVPFKTNGDLDPKGQETLLRHLKEAGVPGVFVAGTTGEFTALDDDERSAVFSGALEVYGADAVYVHVGAAAARQAEVLAARAVAMGATNLAAITPYYLPAGPKALMDYYRRLDADAGDGVRGLQRLPPTVPRAYGCVATRRRPGGRGCPETDQAGRLSGRRGRHRADQGRTVDAGPAGRPHPGGARPTEPRAAGNPANSSAGADMTSFPPTMPVRHRSPTGR